MTIIKTKKNNSKNNSRLLLVLVFIITPLVIIMVGLILVKSEFIKPMLTDSNIDSGVNCKYYNLSNDQKDIYKSYTVKKGDTLQGIANRELKSPTKYSDLVTINKVKYPGLSIQQPYIEVGWELYLPYDYLKPLIVSDTGYVFRPYVEWSQIVEIKDNNFITYLNKNNPKRVTNISKAVFIEKSSSEYKVGDCVKMVVDSNNFFAMAVFPQ